MKRSRFAAASRDGLAEALRVELARTQPQFLDRIDRLVPAMFPKAYRFVAEMEEIAEFLGDGRPQDRFVNLTLFRPPSSS